jgi:putative ABC transport system ATP-binding protein
MIELQHITKVFNRRQSNEVTALNDVSLSVQKGEFVVVIGSNGSGKSTLFNVLAGAETATSGKVMIEGKDVTKLHEYKRSQWIARVFQNPLSGTAPELSIIDNFRLAALRTTQKKLMIGVNDAFKKMVRDKIATLGMGLENKIEQQMGSLSGGQRQALTLLMSVMDKTDILLLDEPTAALDPRSANTILQTADTLIKEYKLTAILITHNLKDAYQYGNRLVQMNEGKVLRDLDTSAKAALKQTDLFEWFS